MTKDLGEGVQEVESDRSKNYKLTLAVTSLL